MAEYNNRTYVVKLVLSGHMDRTVLDNLIYDGFAYLQWGHRR
jgi:hypothetical protein